MPNLITLTSTDERPAHQNNWLVLTDAVVMFLILQFGVTFLVSVVDFAWSALIGTTIHLLLFVQTRLLRLWHLPPSPSSAHSRSRFSERAGFSIWPTVIPHVTVHLIQLVAIPEPCSMTVLLAWLGLQMVMPFLIWAFRKNLLKD